MKVNSVDFYFDFISPYAYFASKHIEDIARRHGRVIRWHPFRLEVAVVEVMGLRPLLETPLKNAYAVKDVMRLAKVVGEPCVRLHTPPDPIPAARLFYAMDTERANTLAKALFRAAWEQGMDIGNQDVLESVVTSLGWRPSEVEAALSDPATMETLTEATRSAVDRGVFGSPTVAVGEELFWGADRLWLLDHYLGAGERYIPLAHVRQIMLGLR